MNKPKLKQPLEIITYDNKVYIAIDLLYSTLEKVKKEWKDDGWEWTENKIYIHITKRIKSLCVTKDICISKQDKNYCCYDEDDEDYSCLSLTLEEHIRLTKTFIALKWEV